MPCGETGCGIILEQTSENPAMRFKVSQNQTNLVSLTFHSKTETIEEGICFALVITTQRASILKITNNWASSIFRPPNQHLDSFLQLFLVWTRELLLLDHGTSHRVQRDALCSVTLSPKGCVQTACCGTRVQKDYSSCQVSKAARCWMNKEVVLIHNLHICTSNTASVCFHWELL